jgi:hypothetical protein
MTAEEAAYFDALFLRREAAILSEPRRVIFQDGTSPQAAQCHANVDRWVRENPGCRGVRGWIVEVDWGERALFAAHSLVEDERGKLVDITLPAAYRFLRHEGEPALYARIEPTNRQRVWPPPPHDNRGELPGIGTWQWQI